MAKVIILNAPPRSGKDTIQTLILQQYNTLPGIFKRSMFSIAAAILGESTYQEFMRIYETDEKDTRKLDMLGGMTCREFMIWISEDVIKPKFGKKHFGLLAAEHFDDIVEEGDINTVIVSDGGFPDEVEALIDHGHQVVLVRMWREGFDFSKDSRDYIYLTGEYAEKAQQFDIHLIHGAPQDAVCKIALLAGLRDDWNDDIPW